MAGVSRVLGAAETSCWISRIACGSGAVPVLIQPNKHNIFNQRNTHKVEQAAEVAGLEPFDVPDVVRLDNTKQVLRVQLQHFDMKSKENVRSGARAHTIHALDEKR